MNIIQKTALSLTLIGAINWGLVGIFKFDLVAAIFGEMSVFSRVLYVLIGLAALINIAIFFIDLDHSREVKERVYASDKH